MICGPKGFADEVIQDVVNLRPRVWDYYVGRGKGSDAGDGNPARGDQR